MMRKKSIKIGKQSVLHYYFLSYFAVLLVPLLICCGSFSHAISVISEDDIRVKESELRHTAVLVDTMLNEISYLGDSLAGNMEVSKFKYEKNVFTYPKSYQIIKLQNAIPELYLINQSIFGYYIFFDQSEMVINKEIAYKYKDFYDLYLRGQDLEFYEEWYYKMKEEKPGYGLFPMETYLYKGKEKKMFVYVRPLMINGVGMDNSVVHIYFEESALEPLLPTLAEDSMQYITDQKGSLIYFRKGQEVKMDESDITDIVNQSAAALKGEDSIEEGLVHETVVKLGKDKYFVICNRSDQSGLSYYTLQPEMSVNQRKVSNTIMFAFCISLAAAVGILLSYYMSLKTATPINDILKETSWNTEQFKEHQSVFSSLKTIFHYLVQTNSKLAEAIESQKPYIRNAFINRLIFESFLTKGEAEKIALWLEMEYERRIFCAVIFRFCLRKDNLEQIGMALLNSCILSLQEVIEQIFPKSLYANIGDDQVVLLLNLPDENTDEDFRRMAEKSLCMVRDEIPFNVAEKIFIYGGSLVRQLSDIHGSYNNATYMFQNERGQTENAVIWYINNTSNIPSYPPADFGMKLDHYVTTGDERALHDELEKILADYLIHNQMPVYLQHMLLDELQIILLRILSHVGMEEEEYWKYYGELEASRSVPQVTQITMTLNLYKNVCKYVENQKQMPDSNTLISMITTYIDSNYGNNNLSLTFIADMFHISESHLSLLFKQTIGINFSAYVEGVRIDKAKDLLKSTSMSIGDISEQIGYYSVNSFCRAFKRVTGLNASEYRRK